MKRFRTAVRDDPRAARRARHGSFSARLSLARRPAAPVGASRTRRWPTSPPATRARPRPHAGPRRGLSRRRPSGGHGRERRPPLRDRAPPRAQRRRRSLAPRGAGRSSISPAPRRSPKGIGTGATLAPVETVARRIRRGTGGRRGKRRPLAENCDSANALFNETPCKEVKVDKMNQFAAVILLGFGLASGAAAEDGPPTAAYAGVSADHALFSYLEDFICQTSGACSQEDDALMYAAYMGFEFSRRFAVEAGWIRHRALEAVVTFPAFLPTAGSRPIREASTRCRPSMARPWDGCRWTREGWRPSSSWARTTESGRPSTKGNRATVALLTTRTLPRSWEWARMLPGTSGGACAGNGSAKPAGRPTPSSAGSPTGSDRLRSAPNA